MSDRIIQGIYIDENDPSFWYVDRSIVTDQETKFETARSFADALAHSDSSEVRYDFDPIVQYDFGEIGHDEVRTRVLYWQQGKFMQAMLEHEGNISKAGDKSPQPETLDLSAFKIIHLFYAITEAASPRIHIASRSVSDRMVMTGFDAVERRKLALNNGVSVDKVRTLGAIALGPYHSYSDQCSSILETYKRRFSERLQS